MFTYFFPKKLQETKGNVTFGELANYVTTEVKKQSIVINGKMQTPLASPIWCCNRLEKLEVEIGLIRYAHHYCFVSL